MKQKKKKPLFISYVPNAKYSKSIILEFCSALQILIWKRYENNFMDERFNIKVKIYFMV